LLDIAGTQPVDLWSQPINVSNIRVRISFVAQRKHSAPQLSCVQTKQPQGNDMITGIVWLFTGVILGWIGSSAINALERAAPAQPAAPVGPDGATLEKLDEAKRDLASRDRQLSFLWMRVGQMARGDYRID
jgi:hypothetical protein